MRHQRLPLATAITAALMLLGSLPSVAEEAAADASKEKSKAEQSAAQTLSTITVSARKREETLQEVPVAVTAFNAQALENLNVEDLSDLDA